MRFLIKLGILLNLIGFFGLFYWETELDKKAVKIDKAVKSLPSEEKALEYFLKKYERKWSARDKQIFLQTIKAASKHYQIDPFDLMTFVALESNYKITATSKPNSNGTRDFGLTQQNSNFYKTRYRIVSKVADSYGLRYNSNNKFDIVLNVMSCSYFISSLRKEIKEKYGSVEKFQLIASYNTGIAGFKRYKKKAQQYYSVFQQLRSVSYDT